MDPSAMWLGRRNCTVCWLTFLFLVLTAPTLSVAQLPTAAILGVVKDSSGAVIPEVSLTARSTDTGQVRSTVSAGDGSYRFPALPVGNYELRAEHPGFRSETRRGLTLTVSQEAVVHFTLEVGAIEQTVAVTAEAPLVNTTSGSLGGLVNEQQMAELPLNGRNYIDLTLMQAGVQQHRNVSQGSTQGGTWFSSNGAPLRSNRYLLDGASMVTINGASSGSISNSTLGVEGIREYRVVTNSSSAEYGMSMGGQVIIVSKGGTNTFHGSLFEYLRNSTLDARNFFDYKTATTPNRLPPYRRNNFGGSLGGPVRKDQIFFFGVYEGLRERLGRTIVSNTISAGCRGPASATITNTACPQLGSVPSVTIAPVTAPLLTLYPEPNLPNNQYTYPWSQPVTENYGQARVDYIVSTSDSLFGRHTADDDEQIQPMNYPAFRVVGSTRSQFATLSESHIFSPTLLNTFRFSYSRTKVLVESPSGIIGPQFSFLPGKEIGTISMGGVTTIGPGTTAINKQNLFTWSDDLFSTRGSHSLKYGALLNHYQQYMFGGGSGFFGGITFANLAAFLTAQPNSYNGITPGSFVDRTWHFNTFGFYAQDDWRVRPRFTLNLGLRYEFSTVPVETKGHGSALRDIQHDAAATVGPPIVNNSLHNFSPRLGFAWDVTGNGQTAVRGGFALLYDVADLGAAFHSASKATPPFSSSSTVSNPPSLTLPLFFPPSAVGKSAVLVDYRIQQPHILHYNLSVERRLPFESVLTLAYAGSRGLNIVQNTEGNPTVPQVLADGRKFWAGNELRTNPNWSTIEFITAGSQSWYNSLQFSLNKRLSKGLQFQSSYTWSKALDTTQAQIGGDNNSSYSRATDPSNIKLEKGPAAFDVAHNWRFNTIYHLPEFRSPGNALRKVLNGWWMGGILSWQTGYPFSVVLQSNRSRSLTAGGGSGVDRPNRVADRSGHSIVSGTTAGCPGVPAGLKLGSQYPYYDPCAFTIQPAGFLGNAGRNILRGPAFANLDFSLVKDTELPFLGEGGKLEFRAEFFNLLNHPNFVTPGLGIGGGASNNSAIIFAGRADTEAPLPSAAKITVTSGTSRQIQFALRLSF